MWEPAVEQLYKIVGIVDLGIQNGRFPSDQRDTEIVKLSFRLGSALAACSSCVNSMGIGITCSDEMASQYLEIFLKYTLLCNTIDQ